MAFHESTAQDNGRHHIPQQGDPDRYQILGEYGRGGLGRVSRAHDRNLGREVAIKELISRSSIAEVRFLREALITARLEHPGIVPVHEAGRWPDGTPFYAMKLVAGRPLRSLIAESETVEDRLKLLHHVIAVADAIAYAHRRNIIHRDLKPANVIVGDFGETIVIDWGLAKDLGTAEEATNNDGSFRFDRNDQLTATGSILGTPAYMAPEQERGEPVDQRADVFAIGAMLWELCSLQKVPPGEARLRHRLLRQAGIDRDLIVIIDKSLERAPELRYRDAGELAADLKAFKAGAHISARTYSVLERLGRWSLRHRTLASSIAVLSALALIGLSIYIHNIAIERSRADHALAVAQSQREQARIAQASLLLEKDPTRANVLLTTLSLHSAQQALLASRATQRAARMSISVSAGIRGITMSSDGSEIALHTSDDELYLIDSRTGDRRFLAQGIEGPTTWQAGEWIYTERAFNDNVTYLAGSRRSRKAIFTDHSATSALATFDGEIYALRDDGALHGIQGDIVSTTPGVVAISASREIMLVCRADGTLEVRESLQSPRMQRCVPDAQSIAIATAGRSFAVRSGPALLSVSRDGRSVDIPMHFGNLFEVAVSPTGLVGIANYGERGSAWFIRPGSRRAEIAPGPPRMQEVTAVAAGGNLVSWGYVDGTVVALDVASGQTWRFVGHAASISFLRFATNSLQLFSTSENNMRTWQLGPLASRDITTLDCTSYNIVPSNNGGRVAFDCSSGAIYAWTLSTDHIVQVHKHAGYAFGVQWLGSSVCSVGWDGKLICTDLKLANTIALAVSKLRIVWLEANTTQTKLVLAALDGRVWQYDGGLRLLYTHHAAPYRFAISDDNLLASCDVSGTIMLYNLGTSELYTTVQAHAGAIHSIAWRGNTLITSGADGTLRSWRVANRRLEQVSAIYLGERFRLTRLLKAGWVANVGEGILVVARNDSKSTTTIDLGSRIHSIDISKDERYVAASTSTEVVVIDLLMSRLSSVEAARGILGRVAFVRPEHVAISAQGMLEMARVDHLDYVTYSP